MRPCQYADKDQLESVLSGSFESTSSKVREAFRDGDVLGVFPDHLVAVVEGRVKRVGWAMGDEGIEFSVAEDAGVQCRSIWALAVESIGVSQRYARGARDPGVAAQAARDLASLSAAGVPITATSVRERAREMFSEKTWWREQLAVAESEGVEFDAVIGEGAIDERLVAANFNDGVSGPDGQRFVAEAEEAADEALEALEALEAFGVELGDGGSGVIRAFVEDVERADGLSEALASGKPLV